MTLGPTAGAEQAFIHLQVIRKRQNASQSGPFRRSYKIIMVGFLVTGLLYSFVSVGTKDGCLANGIKA